MDAAIPVQFWLLAVMTLGVNGVTLCMEKCSDDCFLDSTDGKHDITINTADVRPDTNGGCCATFKKQYRAVRCEKNSRVECVIEGKYQIVPHNWTGCDLQTTTDPAPSASPLNVTAAPPAGGLSLPYRAQTIGSAIIFVAIIFGCILYRSRKILKSCGDEEASPPKTDGGGVGQALLNGHGADHKRTTSGIIV